MATWPTYLPQPNIKDGYSLSPVDQTIRTDMEAGAAKVRRRTSARNDNVAVTWLFSEEQMGAFRSWFDSDAPEGISGGSAWFDININIGNGVVSKVCRFIGTFSANLVAEKVWGVSARIEVR